MRVKLEIATRKYPLKWIEDRKGYKIHLPLAISRTSHEDKHGVVWSFIVGPLVLHLGFSRTSNDPADLPAVAGKVRRDVGLVCEQCGGDCSQDTHWADNGDRRLCSACFSCEPNAGVSSSGDEPEYAPRPCSIQFRIGAKYNWKNQSERLVYLGQNFSGNGLWHQFALVENPGVVWCEVRDDSLQHFEESNSLLDRSHQSNSGA